ncbi:hypothetical protein I4641_05785 [Waterburya agarophytonicola K14]|uniref:Uncharacterized protein n=1 Tax=Waterburya agarophytonicola KI4 TaxID=2874699 RepID=A0A964FGH5_9CYAN|nr:hypothetical protein [Waterburya agarophytonicola KI4]
MKSIKGNTSQAVLIVSVLLWFFQEVKPNWGSRDLRCMTIILIIAGD